MFVFFRKGLETPHPTPRASLIRAHAENSPGCFFALSPPLAEADAEASGGRRWRCTGESTLFSFKASCSIGRAICHEMQWMCRVFRLWLVGKSVNEFCPKTFSQNAWWFEPCCTRVYCFFVAVQAWGFGDFRSICCHHEGHGVVGDIFISLVHGSTRMSHAIEHRAFFVSL